MPYVSFIESLRDGVKWSKKDCLRKYLPILIFNICIRFISGQLVFLVTSIKQMSNRCGTCFSRLGFALIPSCTVLPQTCIICQYANFPVFYYNMYLLRYYNFEPSFKLRWCRGQDLFGSQIPAITRVMELQTYGLVH